MRVQTIIRHLLPLITDYLLYVLVTDLAVRVGIHFPKYKGKYNVWVIAISLSEVEPDRKLQKPILISGWCEAHFKT